MFSCSTTSKKSPPTAKISDTTSEEVEADPKEYWGKSDKSVHADYLFLRAEFEALNNNIVEAESLFEKSYNLSPNSFVAWKMLSSRADDKDITGSLMEAKKLVLKYPKSEYIRATYGELLAKQGLSQEAVIQLEKAISLNPDYIDAYLLLIEVHRAEKKIPEAMVIANDLVKKHPQNSEGWAALAKLHLGKNLKKKALLSSKRAYDLQSRNPENILLYALSLEINGKSKQAVTLYEKLFLLNPTNEELITKMIRLYRQIGSLEDALSLLNEVLNSSKTQNSALLLQKSFILWELKRYEESSVLLDELASSSQKSNRIYYLAALGKEKIKKFEKALEYYNKVEIGSSFYAHAKYRSVNIYKNQKNYDKALKEAYSALDSDEKKSVDFYLVIARIYEEKKEIPNAITILEKGKERHPNNANLIFNLGYFYEKENLVEECIAQMKKVIELDPKFSGAYNYLGYLYAENDRNLDEAEQLIKKALELKPNDGYYLDSLGWVYYKQNKLDLALKILLKANEVSKDEGVILEHIADVYLAKSQVELAIKYYEKSLKTKLSESDRKRIEKKYNQVNKQKTTNT